MVFALSDRAGLEHAHNSTGCASPSSSHGAFPSARTIALPRSRAPDDPPLDASLRLAALLRLTIEPAGSMASDAEKLWVDALRLVCVVDDGCDVLPSNITATGRLDETKRAENKHRPAYWT
jgi:hypothetical protein